MRQYFFEVDIVSYTRSSQVCFLASLILEKRIAGNRRGVGIGGESASLIFRNKKANKGVLLQTGSGGETAEISNIRTSLNAGPEF